MTTAVAPGWSRRDWRDPPMSPRRSPFSFAWTQRPMLAALLLTLIVVAGTLGYVLIEGWTPWESLYMTVITITTVGYR